jgi:CubicO group peptidase (beta-lactamase class C family)
MSGDGKRIADAVIPHTESRAVPGLAWAVAMGDELHQGAAGRVRVDGDEPVQLDTIFRISSMTKPIVAAAALQLVDDGTLALDDPVEKLLPELADRRVLAPGATSLDDTVPAARPITVHDVLTFRLGWGMDFTDWGPNPVLDAAAALGLGAGPPSPQAKPAPEEWLRRLATLPLQRQPGERWLYHVGADVLGVLMARASGQPLDQILRERIFEPLGMVDTGFAVPAGALDRFGPCYGASPEGERVVYDDTDGQWATPPAFPGGGDGLVSTVGDYLAFGRMLLAGGVHDGERLLSVESVAAMTTNHLTPEQLATCAPDPSGAQGWGFGVGVQVRATPTSPLGSYGWSGGLGSSWANDPATGVVGVLMTNQAWTSPVPPPVVTDFWTAIVAR